jgi:hypothetical protein
MRGRQHEIVWKRTAYKEHKYQGDIGFVSLISTAAAHTLCMYKLAAPSQQAAHSEKYPHAII